MTVIADNLAQPRLRPRATIWLLVGWLAVSIATIAAAAGVIAWYF